MCLVQRDVYDWKVVGRGGSPSRPGESGGASRKPAGSEIRPYQNRTSSGTMSDPALRQSVISATTRFSLNGYEAPAYDFCGLGACERGYFTRRTFGPVDCKDPGTGPGPVSVDFGVPAISLIRASSSRYPSFRQIRLKVEKRSSRRLRWVISNASSASLHARRQRGF